MAYNTPKNMKYPIRFLLLFFAVALLARVLDSLLLRTDETVIGELFTHKLFGIALMGWAVYYLGLGWRNIGFDGKRFGKGILIGLCLGVPVYAIAYGVEFITAFAAGEAPSLQFFTTSYNVTGNTEMQSGAFFVLICIAGNIINVIMEDGVFRGLFLRVTENKLSVTKSILFSSALFGIWHGIMPLRNYLSGEQSGFGAMMSALLLILTSFIFGVVLCLLCREEGSLWAGMTIHFINNAGVNLLHIVTSSGTDTMQTMRITVAQTILAVLVGAWCVRKAVKRKRSKLLR
jgi:membrane protease YdiL (CAAX protease family)